MRSDVAASEAGGERRTRVRALLPARSRPGKVLISVISAVSLGLGSCTGAPPVVDRLPDLGGLHAAAARLAREGAVTGLSVAVVHDGKVVSEQVFGDANAATGAPVTPDTLFEAASLGKVVFAYGVLKLVADGRLDLDRRSGRASCGRIRVLRPSQYANC